MEEVFVIETNKLGKVKETLLKDQIVSGASIIFKDAKQLNGKEGYYCYISGIEEQVKKAVELTKDLVRIADEKEKNEIINKIKEEEKGAIDAFGGLF